MSLRKWTLKLWKERTLSTWSVNCRRNSGILSSKSDCMKKGKDEAAKFANSKEELEKRVAEAELKASSLEAVLNDTVKENIAKEVSLFEAE